MINLCRWWAVLLSILALCISSENHGNEQQVVMVFSHARAWWSRIQVKWLVAVVCQCDDVMMRWDDKRFQFLLCVSHVNVTLLLSIDSYPRGQLLGMMYPAQWQVVVRYYITDHEILENMFIITWPDWFVANSTFWVKCKDSNIFFGSHNLGLCCKWSVNMYGHGMFS